jgi:hypothetical protein
MNEHRRSRLKRLAVGTALIGASLASAQGKPSPKPINVNSPPRPRPIAPDAGVEPVAAPADPVYVNSPAPTQPADAGTPPKKK